MKRTTYPSWKVETLKKLKEKILSSKVVGVLDFEGFPAPLFQRIREKLRGKAEILVARNTLIKLALSEASKERKGLEKLSEHVKGQSALVFTDLPPLKLNRLIKEERERAPPKPGRVASTDVIIKAGETDFPPGPIVSELQRVGVKAKVQAGKVVVSEDFTVVKRGEVITREIADLLSKIGIEPVELILKLRAAYEGGLIFSGELLELDEEVVSSELRKAHEEALTLALALDYPTKFTMPHLLLKSHTKALALARSLSPIFLTKETVSELLIQAHLQALYLSSQVEGKGS
ncbi:MAG: 50S ribosomal protein L10 [Candidatus Hadarchaeales archaeon]